MDDIPLFMPPTSLEGESAIIKLLRAGKIASGEYVSMFECAFAKKVGLSNVVTTNDMSSAMLLALYLSGVEEGDEVITSSFACMATNAPIAQLRAKPKWVDLCKEGVHLDPFALEKVISSKTKAVILYHVAGYPAQAPIVSSICKKYGISLIEDCNNAIGAKIDGVHVGAHGDFAVFSFYPNRILNSIEGGALACSNEKQADRAKALRRFGIDASSFRMPNGEINPLSDIPSVGWSITLNNICAAYGYYQLADLDFKIEKTKKNAAIFIDELSNIPEINCIEVGAGYESSYWVLLIQCEYKNELMSYLKNSGVNASGLHYRNDQYTGFDINNVQPLPNTERIQESIIALPCGWWIEKQEVMSVVLSIKNFFRGNFK